MSSKKELERANLLFEELSQLAPCKTCKNDSCEECRWTVFAKGTITESWDHYNYFDGGYKFRKQAQAKGKK